MSGGSYDLILSSVSGSLIVMITLCFTAIVTVAATSAGKAGFRNTATFRALKRQVWVYWPFTMLALTFDLLAKRALGSPPTAAGLVFVMIVGFGSLLSFIWLALLVYATLDRSDHSHKHAEQR